MRSRLVDYLNETTGSSIFHWLIPTPSLIYAIAYCAVAIIFIRRCKNSGLDNRTAFYTAFWGGVAAFIGAKLFYIFLHFKSYLLLPSHILAPGGTVSWGVYMGGTIGICIFLLHRKQPVLSYLDVLGSCIALGPFIGRWSCFLNGDDYGKITDMVWAVKYPRGSYPFAAHANDGIISFSSSFSAAVHPNQIYLSLSALFLFILMTWFWKNQRHHKGLTFGVYCSAYGGLRFFLEFYRDEPGTSLFPALNFPQMMCVLTIGILALFAAYFYRSNIRAILINKGLRVQIKDRGKL